MKKELVAVVAAIAVVFAGAAVFVLNDTKQSKPYHDAVRIYSDSDFLPENGVVGGDGTALNPYIIADWSIRVAPSSGEPWEWDSAIFVSQTTASFIIRNVTIEPGSEGDGILMVDVVNGTVEDSRIEVDEIAVHLIGCSNISVSDSHLEASEMTAFWSASCSHISVEDSSVPSSMNWFDCTDVRMVNCTVDGTVNLRNCSGESIIGNAFTGDSGQLKLEGVGNTTIAANSFEHNGITFDGGSIDRQSANFKAGLTNIIEADNTVANRPIECHIGESGITIEERTVGQMIIMGCTNVTMRSSHASDSYPGFTLILVTAITSTIVRFLNAPLA